MRAASWQETGDASSEAPGDTPRKRATEPLTAPQSFTVEVTYLYTPALREYIQKHALNVPESQRYVVRVEPNELTATFGFRGAAGRTGLSRQVDPVGGTRFAITAPVEVRNWMLTLGLCERGRSGGCRSSATEREFRGEG